MEREDAMPEVENWLRNLQATAADAGQGMVNVLVDILWAFKLRATAGHIYDLAVHLDIYPRNFAKYVTISPRLFTLTSMAVQYCLIVKLHELFYASVHHFR